MNRELDLLARRDRLSSALRTIQEEIREIDAQLAAERVKRIAALDARLAEKERERHAQENPRHPALPRGDE